MSNDRPLCFQKSSDGQRPLLLTWSTSVHFSSGDHPVWLINSQTDLKIRCNVYFHSFRPFTLNLTSRPVGDQNLSFGYVDNTGLSRKILLLIPLWSFSSRTEWLFDFCICINILDFMSKPILFETSCDVVYLEVESSYTWD